MKTISLKEVLKRGLCREDSVLPSDIVLIQCRNFRVSEQGLEPVTIPTFIRLSTTVSHPYPQLFLGSVYRILASDTTIYSVDADWAFTDEVVYDWATEEAGTIVAGSSWHFADMGANFILTNGNTVVFKQSFATDHDQALAWTVSDRHINTVCTHRGRVLFGGFNALDTQYKFLGKGPNWVAWSSIGGGDVFPHIVTGAISDTLSTSLALRNETGAMALPSECTVLAMKPMGSRVIVYTDRAIFALNLAGSTYGLQLIAEVGVYSRESLGGDEQQQIFLDTSGALWSISEEGVRKLGYKIQFTPMILNAEIISVSFDSQKRDFYISGDDACYLLTSQGLSSTSFLIYSLHFVEGGLVATGAVNTLMSFQGIWTTVSDFGSRSVKTIRGLEADFDGTATLGFTYSVDNNTNITDPVTGTLVGGWSPIQVSGIGLSLYLQSTSPTMSSLSDIRLLLDERMTVLQ